MLAPQIESCKYITSYHLTICLDMDLSVGCLLTMHLGEVTSNLLLSTLYLEGAAMSTHRDNRQI